MKVENHQYYNKFIPSAVIMLVMCSECVCVFVCVCLCVCTRVCMCMHAQVCVHVHMHSFMRVCQTTQLSHQNSDKEIINLTFGYANSVLLLLLERETEMQPHCTYGGSGANWGSSSPSCSINGYLLFSRKESAKCICLAE